jgi:imidazolonepropionase-like amidohydrolase
VFGEKTKLRKVIIDGVVQELNAAPVDVEGEWAAEMPGEGTHKLTIDKDNNITVWHNDKSVKATRVSVTPRSVSFAFDAEPVEMGKGVTVMSGALQPLESPSTMTGQGMTAAGEAIQWSARRKPKSLEGLWAAKLGNSPAMAVLVVDKDGGITIARDGVKESSPASDVTYDGTTLTFKSDVPAAGATTTASPTWPDPSKTEAKSTLKGRAGDQPFAAARFAVQGVFKVTEQDGKAVAADDANAPTITIEKDAVSIKVGDKTAKATDVKIDGPRVTYSYNPKDLAPGDKDSKDAKHDQDTKEDENAKQDKDTKDAKPAPEDLWKDELFVTGDALSGTSTLPGGATHTFKAARQPSAEDAAKKAEEERIKTIPETLPTPFGAYGVDTYPEQGTYLITNATVWTSAAAGKMEHASVLVQGGKIAWVGAGSPPAVPAGAITIDAGGKHVTPSIIDCHSHTGISRGVNEGGQAVTSEVRIADVTNPDSMSWYWELAGGVSCVNNLHGSANAIGGQCQTNKIRWGVAQPDDMHMEGAKPSIKFALGENPRQVNGGGSDRYPQTRMGVETLIRDRFTAAREYAAARKGKNPPRRDLELDALAEILDGSRIIHCHSYRQDEIVMLCEVAKDFHFKIGTFQHILEGYKVADYVRDYSGGGSAFSDWWAYKVEVQDAIPQGPTIMHDVGVVVTYNSDSDELARRMNVEAAKAVKYGDLSEEEALKFVTINAAKQMQIDSKTGSLEIGKDADIAIWNGSPLSTLSKCEVTMVDGRIMWSLEADAKLRERNRVDRERIVQKLLADDAGKKPEGAGPAGPARRRRRPTDGGLTGNTLTDEDLRALQRAYEDLQRSGKTINQPGVCGCGLIHEQ